MHWAVAMALTAAAYGLVGLASLGLAAPTAYGCPLYPSAGIALACALVYGWRVLPGVAIGSFGVTAFFSASRGPLDSAALLLATAVAFGAAAQAWLGAGLVKRLVRRPLTLEEPRDLALYSAAAVLSCLVSASVASLALWRTHTLPSGALLFNGLSWWLGDLIGVLIGAPVALTLIGRPRAAWARRRLSVGLTLTVVTLMLALGIAQIGRWSAARVRTAFERDATGAALVLAARLQDPLQALEALRGVIIASEDVTRAEMHVVERDAKGQLSMHSVPELALPARTAVEFRPGAQHIMLMALARPLVAGDTIDVTLRLARAGELTTRAIVRDDE